MSVFEYATKGDLYQVISLIKQGVELEPLKTDDVTKTSNEIKPINDVKKTSNENKPINNVKKVSNGIKSIDDELNDRHLEIVKSLIEDGANINSENNLLLTSIIQGRTEVVKFLMEKGFDYQNNDNQMKVVKLSAKNNGLVKNNESIKNNKIKRSSPRIHKNNKK